jgi:hypothetical protein
MALAEHSERTDRDRRDVTLHRLRLPKEAVVPRPFPCADGMSASSTALIVKADGSYLQSESIERRCDAARKARWRKRLQSRQGALDNCRDESDLEHVLRGARHVMHEMVWRGNRGS